MHRSRDPVHVSSKLNIGRQKENRKCIVFPIFKRKSEIQKMFIVSVGFIFTLKFLWGRFEGSEVLSIKL